MCTIALPSSSREFNSDRWENTRAGISFKWLCASPSESKLRIPTDKKSHITFHFEMFIFLWFYGKEQKPYGKRL